MKTTMMIVMGMFAATVAKADGFTCVGQNTGLNIKMYNHVHAAAGTRNAAIMIISDPSLDSGSTTIATFSDTKNTASNNGATYVAKVDLRVNGSSNKNANIAGTQLGLLASITAEVDFNYSQNTPSSNGDSFSGKASYAKRDGEVLEEKLECTRYKKI